MTYTRTPIIQRTPIVSDGGSDLLLQDSIESAENTNALLSEIQEFQVTPTDQLHMMEDAFTRRFPSLWALKYKTIKGKPTTYVSRKNPFRHRPWQQAIIDDQHPNKVVEKSRQLGLSELNVTEVLHFLATHPQTKVMYTFPTYHQMNDFSTTRVNPVFKDSQYIGNLLSKEVNNVSTKKIGDSYLFMRSSSSGAIGEGVDADAA